MLQCLDGNRTAHRGTITGIAMARGDALAVYQIRVTAWFHTPAPGSTARPVGGQVEPSVVIEIGKG